MVQFVDEILAEILSRICTLTPFRERRETAVKHADWWLLSDPFRLNRKMEVAVDVGMAAEVPDEVGAFDLPGVPDFV